MARELPRVKIGNKEYYMDSKLREFRSYGVRPPVSIKFLSFEKVMKSDTPVTLIQPSREIIPGKENIIISCLTENQIDDLDNMITDPKNKDLLFKIPLCRE